MPEPGRETWSSRAGFVLASIGSAVGIGNPWRFPYVVGTSGGGASVRTVPSAPSPAVCARGEAERGRQVPGGRARRRRGAFRLAAAVLAAGCVGPVQGLYPPGEGESVRSVWVVNHGWHTGIVVRRQDVPHVAGFSGSAERLLRALDVVEIRLSSRGVEKLAAFIEAAYATDAAGAMIPLGAGQHAGSRFYLAREKYHALKTCNVWTARALRAGGCPITALYALTAGNVMYQAAAFCGGSRSEVR
ncbi:MAG: DUF2459 domain-containing protein [Candidatus Rokubacteria bacterium]|nr:DUF2459 domain-containing protein [Candidatus Rokubacteria bacterium]